MKTLLVLLIGLVTSASYAADTATSTTSVKTNQTSGRVPLYIAPTLGVASVSLRNDDGATGNDLGLSVGGLLDIGGKMFSFETGLLFNQLGGKSGNTQINLSYLSIPSVVKWNVEGMHDKTMYLKGGVMTSFLTSQELKTNNASVSGSAVGANAIDLGMLFGVGGNIPLTDRAALVLDVSYLRGLTSVNDEANKPIHNEGFIFSSGVSLAL